jgi:hypothetical protein
MTRPRQIANYRTWLGPVIKLGGRFAILAVLVLASYYWLNDWFPTILVLTMIGVGIWVWLPFLRKE